MASTGKDPTTGMLVTHDYTVEGPVMLFLTTTAIDLDEELLNRCLVLSVNESREQTRAIHGIQRQRETLEGLLAKTKRESLLTLHRNAQRLLQPLAVVNPFADQLSFRDDQTRSRRDHVKYLTLIRSIALLHQFQREIKTIQHQDQTLRYIEVISADIELANELAQEVLGRTVDELLPQTRKLLTLLHGWIQGECERQGVEQAEFHFTRRQAREAVGWGDTQLWTHLGRLVEMEFLLTHRGRGKTVEYELLHQGEDKEGRLQLLGLIDCARFELPTKAEPSTAMTMATTTTDNIRGKESNIRSDEPEYSGEIRGQFGGDSEGFRGAFCPAKPSTDAPLVPISTHPASKTHISPLQLAAASPSYPIQPVSQVGR